MIEAVVFVMGVAVGIFAARLWGAWIVWREYAEDGEAGDE